MVGKDRAGGSLPPLNKAQFARISQLAAEMYQMLPKGTMVRLVIPKMKVIAPGVDNQGGELVVFRPAIRLAIGAKVIEQSGEGDGKNGKT